MVWLDFRDAGKPIMPVVLVWSDQISVVPTFGRVFDVSGGLPVRKLRSPLVAGGPLILVCVTALAQATRDPQAFLRREKGLTKTAAGGFWLADAEIRLREHLGGLDDARRRILFLQKALDERIQNNHILWETNRRRIESLRKTLSSKVDDKEKKRIEEQIKELHSQAVEPGLLPAATDVRTRVIELSNLRHKLTLSVVTIRRLKSQMDADYERLTKDEEVATALSRLGESHRLGPMTGGYATQIRRLGEYEQVVFTAWSPLYIQSGRVRVGAILNERIPVTFTWQASAEPTVLTAGMIEAAGLTVPASAEPIQMAFGRGRRLTVRQIIVPTIRFGGHVLRDVPAYVLPPEGEDLGARIGSEGLAESQVAVEPERLRLVIQPR